MAASKGHTPMVVMMVPEKKRALARSQLLV